MAIQKNRTGEVWRSASVIALLMAALPAAAMAQEEDAASLDAVVVTASRIVRDGYEAPTPTTVLGIADIQKQAPANLADYVNRLPQLGSAGSPRSSRADVGAGISGANFLNLRNLGPARSLVLLDGRRVAGAALTGAVDVNLLPTGLVSRVDLVTGGASAAWGSDAVAGVVNFVLDTRFKGLKGNISGGQSWKGDAETFNADLSFGAPFAEGRGHVIASGSYMKGGDVRYISSRDWFTGYKGFGNTARTATNGQPGFLARDHVGLTRATHGGVILTGPLANTQFGPGGTILPYRPATQSSGNLGIGGDVVDVAGDFAILPPIENQTLFGRVSFDLTDDVSVFMEGSWGKSDTTNLSTPWVRHGDITIRADNPYIPAGLAIGSLTSFQMGRTNYELGFPEGRNVRESIRWVAGIDGKTDWFDGSFKWNAYYQHGETSVYNEVSKNPIRANFERSIDVIRNPAVGGVAGVAVGAPVCRSTVTNPTNGCQPMNLFGYGSPSAASIAYVNGTAWQDLSLKQDVAAAGFQFEPFSTWAGPVSLAGGAEWRRESYTNAVDPIDAANPNSSPFWLANYKAGRGKYNVKEAFGETIIPLARDLPFVKSLDLNGAFRITDYSTSGRVETWKVGLTYDINDELRLRGTRSRDIRAPNLNDLFLSGITSAGGISDPSQAGFPQIIVIPRAGGNPSLTPEIADTLSYGVVYRPTWLSGFSASVDYYSIDIADAITALTAQTIANQCFGVGGPRIPTACDNIIYATPGTLVGATILTGGVNAAAVKLSGIDFEFGYRADLEQFASSLPGSVDLRAVGAYTKTFTTEVGGVVTDRIGISQVPQNDGGGALKWRWMFTGTYNLGPSATTLTARYVGPGVYNNELPSSSLAIDRNKVDAVTYFDLSQSYNLTIRGVDAQIYGVIENLLDKDPPPLPNTAGAAYADAGAASVYHDLIGRVWRVGFRFRY